MHPIKIWSSALFSEMILTSFDSKSLNEQKLIEVYSFCWLTYMKNSNL